MNNKLTTKLKDNLRVIPNFPKKGIMFQDIFSLIEDPVLLKKIVSEITKEIKKENIHIEGFKVEYLVFEGDTTEYNDRLKKLRDIGYSIEGIHDYYNPTITYALCYYLGVWYFGILIILHFEMLIF